MSKTYHSIYAPYIEELIAVKRNMGFKYTYVESVFSDFDQFILQNYNEAIGITKVISDCKILDLLLELIRYTASMHF